MKPFRDWQTEAFSQVNEKIRAGGQDFLTVAGVASGKTLFASRVAKHLIETNIVDRIIVLTPTINLVDNWANTTSDCGLNLRRAFGNAIFKGPLPSDCQGYVTSYASLVAATHHHEICANEKRTHVIFDEPHHLCVVAAYGLAAKSAFKNVVFRHFLTGTPLRSDQQMMPFVEYKQLDDGGYELKPDYVYSFGQAVADSVCRRIAFIPFGEESEIKFMVGDKEHNLSFSDDVNEALQRYRLRSATQIDNENKLMMKMIAEGDRLLGIERHLHKNAGGLVIANDQWAAMALKRMVLNVTGKTAVVVISDDEGAHEKLKLFRNSNDEWLISVRMVSEGVDIPRLRVLIYLSRITEELSFIQSMGRIARLEKEYPGISHFLMPRDERFLAYAKKVEDEMEAFRVKKREGGEGNKPGEGPEVQFTSADGSEGDTILSGKEFQPGILSAVVEAKQKFPSVSGIAEPELAKLFTFVKGHSKPKEQANPNKSWDEIRHDLSIDVDKRVRKYCLRTGKVFSEVHNELNRKIGIYGSNGASMSQLETKMRFIERMIAGL